MTQEQEITISLKVRKISNGYLVIGSMEWLDGCIEHSIPIEEKFYKNLIDFDFVENLSQCFS